MEFGTIVSIAVILLMVLLLRNVAVDDRKLGKKLEALEANQAEFIEAIRDLSSGVWSGRYIGEQEYQIWRSQHSELAGSVSPIVQERIAGQPQYKYTTLFLYLWHDSGRQVINIGNNKFIEQELPALRSVLDDKFIKHNKEQEQAIASDEDNTLVVAGAGTGKTTVIQGKLAYLLDRLKVKPEEILVLSFTGNAVKELNERIESDFVFDYQGIVAQTFHSFGLSVIGQVTGAKPSLRFSTSTARQEFLEAQINVLLQQPGFPDHIVSFLSYYLRPVVSAPGFSNLNDYYQYMRSTRYITLKKEIVRSQQEVMLANFLYLHGVDYKYEEPYEYNTASTTHQQYRPDFYLPVYRLYLEHFGVDQDGEVHFTSNARQNAQLSMDYREQMAWKRELHEQNGTILIETYSYEFSDGSWATNLSSKLAAHGVVFRRRSQSEVLATLRENGSVTQLTLLLDTFLDLFKSNDCTINSLQRLTAGRNNLRMQAFLKLFTPIRAAYENELERTNSIDFHDMLLQAAAAIREKRLYAPYRYIIIDEFQDFSMSKASLVKALRYQNPTARLFCVGDDWQSIFRFSGSDIGLMTHFQEHFGFTRQAYLVTTNRFSNSLANLSSAFVMKNPQQLRKEVRSSRGQSGRALTLCLRNKDQTLEEQLDKILVLLHRLATGGEKASVFLLGRYKHNRPRRLSQLQSKYTNLTIDFLTIHAAKGTEADYVIILEVHLGKYGFPSEIADDPLLEPVLSRKDDYPYSEERRLLYVAMTRARRHVYVTAERGRESVFFRELSDLVNDSSSSPRCPKCSGQLVRRQGRLGQFYGCKNYPLCKYVRAIGPSAPYGGRSGRKSS